MPSPTRRLDAVRCSQSSSSSPVAPPIDGVGQVRDERRQGAGREPLPRVGEDQDVAGGRGDAGIERQRFSAGRNLDEPDRRAKRGKG